MMRILAFLLLIASQTHGQSFSADQLAVQILTYDPPRRPGVSETAYHKGVFILGEVRNATEGNIANFNKADYLNVLYAFAELGEPNAHLEAVLREIIVRDTDCEYLTFFRKSIEQRTAYPKIITAWNIAGGNCESTTSPPPFDAVSYAAKYDVDPALAVLFDQIDQRDRQYRAKDLPNWATLQGPFDRENQRLIDSLFAAHGTYVGRSLVGEQFETVMWAVIQHAPIACMKRYLPAVQRAVAAEELPLVPLRMLVDRILWQCEGYQLYGSQLGVPLAEEPQRRAMIEKYGLE